MILGIIFKNQWQRCILFHIDHIFFFTQEPALELPAQAQVSLTLHNINFFLSEFNVYSRNLIFFIIKKIFRSYFCLYRY